MRTSTYYQVLLLVFYSHMQKQFFERSVSGYLMTKDSALIFSQYILK